VNKKKAIKILSATAVAATAFVATSPAQAASTNDAASLVKKAKDAGTVLKWAISTEGSADGKTRPYAQYNTAKAARDAAVAAVNKLPSAQKAKYLADLEQNVTLHINRTMAYIDAITAGEKITVKKQALEAQIAKNLIDDNTESAYHALSTEIRKQAILLDRVYGQSTRDEIRKEYKKSAEAVRDSVKYEITVKIELDLAKKALAANNTADVEKHLAEAAKYMKEVKNEAMKAALTKAAGEIEAQLTPVVKTVSSLNGKEIAIAFNKAIDAKSVIDENGNLINITITGTGTPTFKGELSADKKTLIATANIALDGEYTVNVNKESVKAEAGDFVQSYISKVNVKDNVAPAIIGTERVNLSTVKVIFSEPISTEGTVSFKYADGSAVAGATFTLDASGKFGIVKLGSDVTANKEIAVQFIGAKDFANNLMTPNPATVQVVKQQADGIKPVVSTISQTGADTFNIKFSKDVTLAAGDAVVVSGYTVKSITKVTDSEYKVTVDKNLKGLQNVTVKGFTDLSDQAGEAVTKVVSFSEDTVAPKAANVTVVVGADKAEYLELTFDKDVTEGKLTISGSYVKDHVTSTVSAKQVDAKYASTASKKVLRVKLADFATVKEAAYKVDIAKGSSNSVASLSGVALDKTSASFTRGEDGVASNTTKLAAPAIAVVNNDTLTVTFTGAVDGASATNEANYKVDGAVVESATLAAVSGGKQVITLKLQANSNTFTGVRNITVENVKALGSSVTMDKFVKNDLVLTENVRPTVTNAKLTANNEITLTFSEAVYDVTNTKGADFDLYIGGTKVTATTLATENVSLANGKNTLKLSVAGTAITEADFAKGLTIKAANTLDVKDVHGNGLTFTSGVVAQ